ncbi:AAA family ATPase [Maricaulis sp. CAU 1757]
MKLRSLRVRNIGPFGQEGCVLDGFTDGLNVVREGNEAGKTTLYRALELILFDAYSSKKKHIKDLRCDRSTEGLYVELDLEIDGQGFRLAKQYLKGEMAAVSELTTNRVIAESKDAEAWITDKLGTDNLETSSPGLLWVRQGASLLQPSSQGGAGHELFGSLEGEIETVVGGDKANAVLHLARDKLSEYQTDRGKPRLKLKDAMDEVQKLRVKVQELDEQVCQSEAARAELIDVESKLDGLSKVSELEHNKKLADARNALNEAIQAEEKVKSLRVAREAAVANAANAKAELERFQDRLQDLAGLNEKREAKRAEAASVRKQIDALDQELAPDREKVAALKQSYENAKSALADAEETTKKIKAISQRRSIIKALNKAREITRSLVAARKSAAVPLPELDEINDAHEDLIKCRSEAAATRPSLHVKAASAEVLLNESQIRKGDPVLLSGLSKLTYQDLQLTIETPDREGTESALAVSQERLDALLKACGVEDVAAARKLHEARKSAANAAERLENELAEVAPDGVDALEAALDSLPSNPAEDDGNLEPPNVTDLSDARNRAEADFVQANSELDAAERNLRDKRAEARRVEDQVRQLTEQLGPIEQALGSEKERAEKENSLTLAHDRRLTEMAAAKETYEVEADRQPSVEVAQERVKRLEQIAQNRSQEIARLSEELGKLKGQLKQAGQAGAEEELANAQAELAKAESEEAALLREGNALRLLVDALDDGISKRRQQYFEPVKAVVDPLIAQVLGGASVSFNDDFGPAEIERKGIRESLDRLSGGTREQIAILTRLGFAKVMAAQGVHVPVILDDALVFCDDDRIEKMFDVINVVAKEIQIIAFSCRQRAFEQLGGTHIHKATFKNTFEQA